MKYVILSTGILIASAILYSAAYITSAIIKLIGSSVGDDVLTSQAQPLYVLSIIALIAAILILIIGFLKKDNGIKQYRNDS
ncbi:hypothetical protein [Jeotgalibacillus proteolyticus]|uniref:hypothetical protein n=1 Tax=Jeotgalibacillus proteolyticus TaxID=2082395 RepID=UPI003CF6C678